MRQAGLLRDSTGFRLLFVATLGSGVGTWIAVVALTVDVFDRTHSGAWVSALLIADFLPAIAIGLLLGPLVDRLSRQRLMVGADLARLAVFCALPFVDSAAGIVGLAAAAGFATGFFRPAVRAALPNLVDDADLPRANSLVQSAESTTNAAGPLLGGVLVAASGPHAAYWLNAATFAISAALVVRIAPGRLQSRREPSRGHWLDLREGFETVLRTRALLTVFVTWTLVTLAVAGLNVAEVVIAKVSFNAGTFGFGLLSSGFGVGLAIGSLWSGSVLERRGLAAVYGGGIGLLALGAGGAAVSPNVWVAVWCVVVAGIGNGAAVVCNALLVQRGAPDRLRGRAFTVIMSTNYAALGLAMIAAGQLVNAFGARWLWGGAAIVAAVAAVVGLALARSVPESARGLPAAVPAD